MPKTAPSKPSSSKACRAALPSARTTRSKVKSATSPNAAPAPLSKALPSSASLPPKASAASLVFGEPSTLLTNSPQSTSPVKFGPPRGIKPNELTSKSLKKKTNTSSSAVSTPMSPPKPSTSKFAPPASSLPGKSKPTSRTSILPPALAAPRAGSEPPPRRVRLTAAQFANPAYPDSDQPMSLDLDVSTVSKKELDPFEMTDQERRSVHFLDHPFVADLIPLVRRGANMVSPLTILVGGYNGPFYLASLNGRYQYLQDLRTARQTVLESPANAPGLRARQQSKLLPKISQPQSSPFTPTLSVAQLEQPLKRAETLSFQILAHLLNVKNQISDLESHMQTLNSNFNLTTGATVSNNSSALCIPGTGLAMRQRSKLSTSRPKKVPKSTRHADEYCFYCDHPNSTTECFNLDF
ncbi:hypothetical protein B0H16DRAFT_1730453 [Mycena metata]|uniref:Uncharacterized protein n=1 Tax=Mycena metata TaxID=1033252 RepID=A0AAD7MZ13_9AGAR|nr:hypothetical protein B0H16DRAFT_1730453 [Mycena metata]